MIVTSRALRLSCAALMVAGLAACSHSAPSQPTVAASPTPTVMVTTKPVVVPVSVDPLTGGPVNKNPVVAVKIDDTASGRPQVGIDKADVVFIEQVEGGVTRTLAVFHTRKPAIVGPVRSTRSNDPEIMAQFGAVAFAASGGGGDSLPVLDASNLKADINDRGGPGYFRDDNRNAPYNLMLTLAKVPVGATAKSIGWSWAGSTANLTKAPRVSSINTVVGGTAVQFTYDAKSARYVRVIDGARQFAADGTLITTPNVIVQFCPGHVNPADIDQAGNPGWFTQTTGTGKVAIFRNGREITGTWSRPTPASGTVFKDAGGRVIALNPGGAWVVLATTGAPLN